MKAKPEDLEPEVVPEPSPDEQPGGQDEVPAKWYDAKWFRQIKVGSLVALGLAIGAMVRGCVSGTPPAPPAVVKPSETLDIPPGGSPDSPFRQDVTDE